MSFLHIIYNFVTLYFSKNISQDYTILDNVIILLNEITSQILLTIYKIYIEVDLFEMIDNI